MPVRVKGMVKTVTVDSPFQEGVQFVIKRASNREDVERVNMFSKMKVIQNLGTPNEIATERDVNMGDVQIHTIAMCLVSWNLEDEHGRTYDWSDVDNIYELLSGAERRWLYEEIMKLNPIWRGEDELKADSEAS